MTIKNFLLSWGMLMLGVIMNVFGVYVVKMKINTLGEFSFNSFATVVNYFLTLAKSPLAIIGAIAIMAAPFPYAIALSRMELSMAYPLSVALNCILVLLLTVLFLGEALTWNKGIAITMILVSLYLMYK